MLFNAATFSSLSLLVSSVAAHGLNHEHLHRKRQAPPAGVTGSNAIVVTTGATGYGDNQVHSRLEINDLAANRPDQWTLFVGAIRNWMDGDSGNGTGTSYWEVAGVHGMPRVDWNGVPACDSCQDADGYCTHDICLFPAWHRAYVAQFEQTFLTYVQELANQYTGTKKQTMLDAAATMRFPYWDWAAKPDAGSDVFPAFLAAPQIVLDLPAGQQTVDNPLYEYVYHSQADVESMYFGPFETWSTTKRYPNSNNADATSNNGQDVSAFNNLQANIADQVYSLFGCDDYLHFSNDAAGATQSCPNSIEGIHNTIHMTSGGPGSNGVSGGHMTYLPEAAFDVIFFLHHCNVDRILALWQTVNPNSWGAQCTAPHDTWTIAQGETVDGNTDLKPFRKDSSSFWSTNDVENWEQNFAYTYPEFSTTDGSRQSIINLVNEFYGPNANLTASSISKMAEQNSTAGNSGRALGGSSTTSAATGPTGFSSMTLGLGNFTRPTGVAGGLGGLLGGASGSASAPGASPTGGLGGAIGGMIGSIGSAIGGAIGGAVGAPTGTAPFPNITIPWSSTFGSSNGSEYTYTCHCQAPRYTLNGSYEIYVFDQAPQSNDSSTWLGDEGCIGTIGVLAGGEMTNSNVHVTGAIPMTRHLQHRCDQGQLAGMNEQTVVPYLTQNLHWKIVKKGEEVHPSEVPTFQAAVFSGASTKAGVGSLPKLTSYVPQVEVTKNKAGGAQSPPSWVGGYSGSSSNTGSAPASSSSPCPEESSAAPVPQSSGAPWSSQAAAMPQSSEAAAQQASSAAPQPYGAQSSPVSPVQSSAPAAPWYPASNNSSAVWQPTATGTGSWSSPSSTGITPYTGAASKASYSFAALAVAAGLVAAL